MQYSIFLMGNMLSYVCYVILTWGCLYGSTLNSEYDIPDEIYEMCSYVDICHRKATLQLPEGYTSCCQSCSCDEDCGLTLNCCFDHLDKYRLVEKGEITCTKPTIGNKKQQRHYYMISSCKSMNQVRQNVNTSACQLLDKNGTNLLAPVSSVNGVYINAKCAECNNDFNYKTWDYVHYSERFTHNAHIQWVLEHNSIGDSGSIEYLPPSSDKLSAPKACYQPSVELNCSDKGALKFPLTCKNLKSVYLGNHRNTIYRNAACVLCNSSLNREVLPRKCIESTTFNKYNSFNVLIDSEVLNALSFNEVFKPDKDVSATKTCKSGSIKSLLTGRCLSVYCPDGLIRTKSSCKHLFKRWYADAILMAVKLSADDRTSLPVNKIQSLPSQYLFNPNLWMKPPCPGMKPVSIYYENRDLAYVNSFIVHISKFIHDGRGFSPSRMYPILRSCFEKPWTVLIMNVSYTFTVKLYRNSGYIQDGMQSLHLVSDPFKEIDPRPKLYDRIIDERYGLIVNYPALIVIRKTFFCNQVRLPEEEVELGYGEVRVLASNKTLGISEFTYNVGTRQDVSLNFTCNICLEDYIPRSSAFTMIYVRRWFITGNVVLIIMFCSQYCLGRTVIAEITIL